MEQIILRAEMTTTAATVYLKVGQGSGLPADTFWPGRGDGSHSHDVQSTDWPPPEASSCAVSIRQSIAESSPQRTGAHTGPHRTLIPSRLRRAARRWQRRSLDTREGIALKVVVGLVGGFRGPSPLAGASAIIQGETPDQGHDELAS